MFRNKSIVKYVFVAFISMILFSSANALNFEDLTVSSTNNVVTKSFDIDKIENYPYVLKYSPWGTLNETFTATVYINGNEIEMHQSGNQRTEVSKDISDILVNGKNELKIVSNIPKTYTISLRLRNIQISEPSKPLLNLPVTLKMNFLSIAVLLLLLKKFK